jgi:hypothetical protein
MYVTFEEFFVAFDVELGIASLMRYKSRSGGFQTFSIEGHVIGTDRTLYKR